MSLNSLLSTRLPKWVKKLPSNSDKDALVHLAAISQGKFDKPREINFVLSDFHTRELAEKAAFVIEQRGWQVVVVPRTKAKPKAGAEEQGPYTLVATDLAYALAEERYHMDTAFFHRIALLYEADYDGWHAKAVRWPVNVNKAVSVSVAACVVLFFGLRLAVVGVFAHDVLRATSRSTAGADATGQPQAAPDPSAPTTVNVQPPSSYPAPVSSSAYNPNAPMLMFNASDMGVVIGYPNTWSVEQVVYPCEPSSDAGFRQECDVRLIFSGSSGRYAPTIRITRLDNTLEQAEALYGQLQDGSNGAIPTKEVIQVSGHPAIRYVKAESGDTDKMILVGSGKKTYVLEAEQPRSTSLAPQDFFAEFDRVVKNISIK